MVYIQKRILKDGSYVYQIQWRDRDTGCNMRQTFDSKAGLRSWLGLLQENSDLPDQPGFARTKGAQ